MVRIIFTCAGILTLLTGCFLLLIGILIIRRELQFGKHTRSARAVIIGFKEGVHISPRRGGGTISSPIYYPIVRFQKEDGLLTGQYVTCELRAGSHPAFYRVGAQVPVLYDPSNPQLTQINTFRSRWLGICLLFILSFIALLLGISVLVSMWA